MPRRGAFYERLGFRTVGWWLEVFGGYAILTRGGLEMHFFLSAKLSPLANDGQCYWRVADVDALYQDIRAAGVGEVGTPRVTAPEDRPWGMREFALSDPNGNLVRVGQPAKEMA